MSCTCHTIELFARQQRTRPDSSRLGTRTQARRVRARAPEARRKAAGERNARAERAKRPRERISYFIRCWRPMTLPPTQKQHSSVNGNVCDHVTNGECETTEITEIISKMVCACRSLLLFRLAVQSTSIHSAATHAQNMNMQFCAKMATWKSVRSARAPCGREETRPAKECERDENGHEKCNQNVARERGCFGFSPLF